MIKLVASYVTKKRQESFKKKPYLKVTGNKQ